MQNEQIIQEFLGERPRAEQIEDWLVALRERLQRLREDVQRSAAAGEDVPGSALRGKIARLEKQIRALEEERAVTEFVEDSVRVTLAMGAVTEGAGEDEWLDEIQRE